MRALDLFCGACGGWSVGLHANGIETAAACEIDPWRRETFSRNFPKARMYDDVRTLTADRLRSDLGFLPDIIVGSPPCQDASTANSKGKGVDGERTGLFFDAVRLVSEVRPVWACFENVPGLRARGYDRVHDALEAVGYTIWPLVVGAWHAGAPHRRNRVWIVAVANEGGQRADVAHVQPGQPDVAGRTRNDAHAALVQRPPLARDQSDGLDQGDVAHPYEGDQLARAVNGEASGVPGSGDASDAEESAGRPGPDQPLAQLALSHWQDWNGGPPDLGRVDDGLPKGMARKMLSAYGDAVVPAVTTAVIRAIQTARAA